MNTPHTRSRHTGAALVFGLLLVLLGGWTAPASADAPPEGANQTCPVMTGRAATSYHSVEYDGATIYFCCAECVRAFSDNPEPYLGNIDLAHAGAPGLLAWLGRWHVLIVHFPVGLLLAGAMGELVRLITRWDWLRDGVRFSVWSGAIGAMLAAPLGWLMAGGDVGADDWLLGTHRWLGTTVFFWALGLVAVMELAPRRPGTRWPHAMHAMLFGGAVLVGLTGHFGGMLVFGTEYLAW